MGRPLGTWVLVGALVVAHFVLHVGLGWGRGAPDLLTIGLLLAAREVGLGTGAAIGLGFGLLEDALSVLAFGANAITMTALGIAGAFTRDLFVGDTRIFVISYFFVGKWMRDLLHWMMVSEGLRPPFAREILLGSTLAAIYASVIGLVLLTLLGRGGESR